MHQCISVYVSHWDKRWVLNFYFCSKYNVDWGQMVLVVIFVDSDIYFDNSGEHHYTLDRGRTTKPSRKNSLHKENSKIFNLADTL